MDEPSLDEKVSSTLLFQLIFRVLPPSLSLMNLSSVFLGRMWQIYDFVPNTLITFSSAPQTLNAPLQSTLLLLPLPPLSPTMFLSKCSTRFAIVLPLLQNNSHHPWIFVHQFAGFMMLSFSLLSSFPFLCPKVQLFTENSSPPTNPWLQYLSASSDVSRLDLPLILVCSVALLLLFYFFFFLFRMWRSYGIRSWRPPDRRIVSKLCFQPPGINEFWYDCKRWGDPSSFWNTQVHVAYIIGATLSCGFAIQHTRGFSARLVCIAFSVGSV